MVAAATILHNRNCRPDTRSPRVVGKGFSRRGYGTQRKSMTALFTDWGFGFEYPERTGLWRTNRSERVTHR